MAELHLLEQEARQQTSHAQVDEPERDRAAAIAESRKKLEELEKDAYIWRKAAERRREIEEQEARLMAAEKKRKQEQKHQEELAAQIKQQAIENDRVRRWEKATVLEENRCRKDLANRQYPDWNEGESWDNFVRQLQAFKRENFSEARPLTFEIIPWPVLRPSYITKQDIMEFFSVAQQLDTTPRKVLAGEILRVFHVDKSWAQRLGTVYQEELRGKLLELTKEVTRAAVELRQM